MKSIKNYKDLSTMMAEVSTLRAECWKIDFDAFFQGGDKAAKLMADICGRIWDLCFLVNAGAKQDKINKQFEELRKEYTEKWEAAGLSSKHPLVDKLAAIIG